MNLLQIQQIIADQKDILSDLMARKTCARAEEADVDLKTSKLAQVVTGVRRSGKSTLCLNVLKSTGKPFGYVNFDDERLASLTGEDLDTVFTACLKVYGTFDTLFLDEPQNVPAWSLFVNRLLRKGLHILVTGSNSNLLGGELATHMTGRYREIRLLPFSFHEYCVFRGVDVTSLSTLARAQRSSAFDEYLKCGAFPEVVEGEEPRYYIRTLVESIRVKDIERRYKIRYKAALRKLVDHVLNVTPMVLDADGLSGLFSFKSKQTASNYVDYMERSFLVTRISKYASKPKQRIFGEKLYPIDVAFMNARENAFQGENLGWRLETVVGLELVRRARRRLQDVYWYKDTRHECDFVLCQDRTPIDTIQVSYDLSNPKTRAREIEGAVAAAKALKLKRAKILTYAELDEVRHSSGVVVEIMSVPEWAIESPL